MMAASQCCAWPAASFAIVLCHGLMVQLRMGCCSCTGLCLLLVQLHEVHDQHDGLPLLQAGARPDRRHLGVCHLPVLGQGHRTATAGVGRGCPSHLGPLSALCRAWWLCCCLAYGQAMCGHSEAALCVQAVCAVCASGVCGITGGHGKLGAVLVVCTRMVTLRRCGVQLQQIK